MKAKFLVSPQGALSQRRATATGQAPGWLGLCERAAWASELCDFGYYRHPLWDSSLICETAYLGFSMFLLLGSF